ncbi:MAG: hypothetical protein MI748_20180 [Opitutales bacterium]|nr:hypothetical protein [Opitutales bacterium]
MIANVKGFVVDRFIKQSVEEGKEDKYVIRLYQGQRDNLDVSVNKETYGSIKDKQSVEIKDVKLGMYSFDGRSGMYAKQQF